MAIDPRIVAIGMEMLPSILAWFRGAFQKAHPGDPLPPDEDIIAAYNQAYLTSRAKNAEYLATHPVEPETP